MDIYWVHRQEHTDHMFVVPSSWSIRLPSLPNSPEWKKSEVAQSCQTLCNPMDCSLSGSSVYGIFQARVLEWIAISFSRGSSQPRNRIWFPAFQADALASEPPGNASFILRTLLMHYCVPWPSRHWLTPPAWHTLFSWDVFCLFTCLSLSLSILYPWGLGHTA